MPGMSISRAIRESYEGRVTQVELAEALGVSQKTISDWGNRDGKLGEWLDQLNRLMALAGRPAGYYLVKAGYVPVPRTVEDALSLDPELTDEAKDTVRRALEAAREHSRAVRSGQSGNHRQVGS